MALYTMVLDYAAALMCLNRMQTTNVKRYPTGFADCVPSASQNWVSHEMADDFAGRNA